MKPREHGAALALVHFGRRHAGSILEKAGHGQSA